MHEDGGASTNHGGVVEYLVDDLVHSILDDGSFDFIIDKGTLGRCLFSRPLCACVPVLLVDSLTCLVVDTLAAAHCGDTVPIQYLNTLIRLCKHGGVVLLQTGNHTKEEIVQQ